MINSYHTIILLTPLNNVLYINFKNNVSNGNAQSVIYSPASLVLL